MRQNTTRWWQLLTQTQRQDRWRLFSHPLHGKKAVMLLDIKELGDRKPSEVMDKMLALLGDHRPCFFFGIFFSGCCQKRSRPHWLIPPTSPTTEPWWRRLITFITPWHRMAQYVLQCNSQWSRMQICRKSTLIVGSTPSSDQIPDDKPTLVNIFKLSKEKETRETGERTSTRLPICWSALFRGNKTHTGTENFTTVRDASWSTLMPKSL